MDRSHAACRNAARNAAALGLAGRAGIVCGCWGEGLVATFDVVASNPPYIATGVIPALAREVRDHDPTIALDGGDDGLRCYRRIVPQVAAMLAPGGLAAFECGFDQGDAVALMMRAAGLEGVALHSDLAGHGRVVLGWRAR